MSKVLLRGGLRDGKLCEVGDVIGFQCLATGKQEDRRFSHLTPEGVPVYSYPHEVYRFTHENEPVFDYPIYEYSYTEAG